ncbi:MAG TPA: VTT domain-containing protein [Anaerolineae bacterium]|nr:VTT domain-containing protein [Anaerolineae bacterium]HOV49684.1 VTT domain-containing protein [Anaerolineae bacterium]HPD41637.1 VTT domain-containing protein [Anaerolineae bacterium]HUM37708.1 VTT domain-containing protein [Anaerolineae bacterium]HXK43774.1 VTT domain-containing protein [Anaerolineae bacterium]
MSKKTRVKVLRGFLVVFFVAVTVLAAIFREQLSSAKFRDLGYVGVFLMAWIGSTTVVLPIPHLAFTFTMGSVLTPWYVGLCAGFGDSLGELWGYLAGYAVEDIATRWRVYPTIEGWMRRNGVLTVFLMGSVPMPLFDLAGIAGGATGFPVWKFYLATWAGKTLKAIIFAWGGHYGVAWLAQILGL